MNEIIESLKQPEFMTAVLVLIVNAVIMFLKAFIDAAKPGKADKLSQRVVLGFIRKILVWISPEELGRKAALKVNPDSPNARRISDNKRFTKEDAQNLNRAVIEARMGRPRDNGEDWDFI